MISTLVFDSTVSCPVDMKETFGVLICHLIESSHCITNLGKKDKERVSRKCWRSTILLPVLCTEVLGSHDVLRIWVRTIYSSVFRFVNIYLPTFVFERQMDKFRCT